MSIFRQYIFTMLANIKKQSLSIFHAEIMSNLKQQRKGKTDYHSISVPPLMFKNNPQTSLLNDQTNSYFRDTAKHKANRKFDKKTGKASDQRLLACLSLTVTVERKINTIRCNTSRILIYILRACSIKQQHCKMMELEYKNYRQNVKWKL